MLVTDQLVPERKGYSDKLFYLCNNTTLWLHISYWKQTQSYKKWNRMENIVNILRNEGQIPQQA